MSSPPPNGEAARRFHGVRRKTIAAGPMSTQNPFEDPQRWRAWSPVVRIVVWAPATLLWLASIALFGLISAALLIEGSYFVAAGHVALTLALLGSFVRGVRSARRRGGSGDVAMARGFKSLLGLVVGLFWLLLMVAALIQIGRLVVWFFS